MTEMQTCLGLMFYKTLCVVSGIINILTPPINTKAYDWVLSCLR